MTATDVVRWMNSGGCHRCGHEANYYVQPYWDRKRQVCAVCCMDLNRLFERQGWPVE